MAAPSPALAALLATFLPGGGQIYLDDMDAALWVASSELALVGGALAIEPEPSAPGEFKLTPRLLGLQLASQVHVYSIYAAWRDARRLRRPETERSETNGFSDLAMAPFQSHALSPMVALPVASLAAVIVGSSLLSANNSVFDVDDVTILGTALSPGVAFAAQVPVHGTLAMGAAVSEEALFRGMVQTGMRQWWGPSGAVAAQAVLFGLAHLPNAFIIDQGRSPLRETVARATLQVALTGFLGGWMGHLVEQDAGDLRRAVAFHFWYNFAVMSAGFAAAPQSTPLRFSLSLPF